MKKQAPIPVGAITGAVIRFLRIEGSLTSRTLATQAGISQSILSGLENGLIQPTVSHLFRIDHGLLVST